MHDTCLLLLLLLLLLLCGGLAEPQQHNRQGLVPISYVSHWWRHRPRLGRCDGQTAEHYALSGSERPDLAARVLGIVSTLTVALLSFSVLRLLLLAVGCWLTCRHRWLLVHQALTCWRSATSRAPTLSTNRAHTLAVTKCFSLPTARSAHNIPLQ
eukprot:COSAG02_NODE_128_length_34833_cov_44.465221_16_plen_155_part_00